jgi:hypothetical protein
LRLRRRWRDKGDGTMGVSIHAIRKKPEIDRPYFGVRFTDEDKHNLMKNGNLGRIAEAEYTKGMKTPVYLSLDPQTNEPTKHAQAAGEPMKQGQTQPTEKQAAAMDEDKPKKARGMKM